MSCWMSVGSSAPFAVAADATERAGDRQHTLETQHPHRLPNPELELETWASGGSAPQDAVGRGRRLGWIRERRLEVAEPGDMQEEAGRHVELRGDAVLKNRGNQRGVRDDGLLKSAV